MGTPGLEFLTSSNAHTVSLPINIFINNNFVIFLFFRSDMHAECRYQCAFNFPAMVVFIGPSNFIDILYPTFVDLAADPAWRVRQTLARGLHEVAKLVGVGFKITKTEVSNLFADSQIEVLEAMVSNMVHVIDALARHGVLQFAGQGGKYSHDLSRSLLNCEETISMTRNWRLQVYQLFLGKKYK